MTDFRRIAKGWFSPRYNMVPVRKTQYTKMLARPTWWGTTTEAYRQYEIHYAPYVSAKTVKVPRLWARAYEYQRPGRGEPIILATITDDTRRLFSRIGARSRLMDNGRPEVGANIFLYLHSQAFSLSRPIPEADQAKLDRFAARVRAAAEREIEKTNQLYIDHGFVRNVSAIHL